MPLVDERLRILLVEDDTTSALLLRAQLRQTGARFDMQHVTRLADALAQVAGTHFDVVLLDLGLDDSWGIATLVSMNAVASALPIVVMTSQNDEELGARALQQGAQDYLIKGQPNGQMLLRSMRYAIERKHIDEALRESELRYRTLVEQMPAIIYTLALDEPGTPLYISPQLTAILGFSQEEWLSNPQLHLHQIHLADRDRLAAQLALARAQGQPLSVEYRMLTRDGRTRWFHDTGAIVRDQAGKPLFMQGVMLDITERKQAEEAVRESEERFRSAFDYAAIGMALVGLDGRWLQVNRSLCEIVGYTEPELLAATFQEITHPDDLESDLSLMQQLIAGEIRSYQMEKRYIHKLAYEVWISLSVSLVRDAQGQPLYFISQIQNITERRRAEQGLRASEERYRTLVENLPLSVFELSHQGQVLSMNQAGLQMIGARDVATVLDRPYMDMLPIAERSALRTAMGRAYGGEMLEVEYRSDGDGQPQVFTTSLIPQRDAGGRVDKLLGTTQDITERIRMRLVAEQDRDRLDAILESSNDAIVMIDLDGRVAMVNRAFRLFFGAEPEDVAGMQGLQLLDERRDYFQDTQQFHEMVRPLFDQPQSELIGEVTLLRPTRRVLVWYSGPVRTRSETTLGRLFVFRDATREKESDMMKSEFISIVSHELRTPLTSIKGFTDLILEGDAGEISAEVHEFLEIVKSSADQLVEITDDILEASRIEAGKVKLNLQPIHLEEVARAVALSMQMMFQSKGQRVDVVLPRVVPVVLADRERLVQILTNLLSNAHKYTPAGGQIAVRVEITADATAAHIAAAAQGVWAVISVVDNGLGISKEDLQHLFTRFYRVSSPETQEIGGTGLGLHITRSLVEMQGGAIWVSSVLGEGSTFAFSLPIAQPAAALSAPAEMAGQLVLLADSDAARAAALQQALEQAGCAVVAAQSGAVALAYVRDLRPALLVLAHTLSDMDAHTMIEQLRADMKNATIPIVDIPSGANGESMPLPGAIGSLGDPADTHQLIGLVRDVLACDRRSIVLVAEPDPQVAQALRAVLAQHGYSVCTAVNGLQCLDLAARLQPSLILLDLWMPDLSGFRVLNMLRQQPETSAIPVVALNDSDIAPSAIRRVVALGSIELLTKPSNVLTLQHMIAAWLEQRKLRADGTNLDSKL